MEENVLILGATSDMAVAIARKFASEGYSITLAARNAERLADMEADLKVRYNAWVSCVHFDAVDFDSHELFYQSLTDKPDIVVCVVGLLGDQVQARADWTEAQSVLFANYVGVVSILNVIANDFEKRRRGIIVGISSVAGERGRQSNYVYGSAKAGLTTYLAGLRNRLFHSGVHVLTVKPGFVKTRMIENINTPGPLTASVKQVADKVYSAVRAKRNVIYVLPVWAWVMWIIRNIPETLFKRLRM